ncbi:MAG: DUF1987 domain-containing protein [Bacteroidota bacterium]|nr:MAG: DUF1987 domain-containing protein [Bacteroidota bacterium]
MNKLEIAASSSTPKVVFDPSEGVFKIEGRAIPENPSEFFNEPVVWLKEYFKDPLPLTILAINLEYVNSGSAKYLLTLFRVLREATLRGHKIEITWYFEEDDEAIESLGEHYKTTSGIPFRLVQYI